MVRPAGWSGCGSSPTVLPSRRGAIIGRQKGVTFESKLTIIIAVRYRYEVQAVLQEVFHVPLTRSQLI